MKFQERKIIFSLATSGILLFVALWLKGLNAPFVYDDQWTIVQNPALREAFHPGKFFTDPKTVALPELGMHTTIYRPLPTLTFAFDYKLWGLQPGFFRLWNIAGHFLNGALIFFILWRRLDLKVVPAMLGAFVFWFHPAQVETVQWITQRSNVLCLFFMLTALYFFNEKPWLGVLGFTLALLSKEAGIVTPVLFFLLDKNRKKHTGLYILMGLTALAYVFFRMGVLGQMGQRGYRGSGWLDNVLIGAVSWLEYLKLLVWPAKLTVSHFQYVENPWESVWPWVGIAAQVLFLSGAVVLWMLRKTRIAQALLWIFISLFLVLGFFPTDTFVAERFLYIALPGFALLLAVLCGKKNWGKVVLGGVVLIYAARSHARLSDFQSETALWQASVAAEPRNAFAWACLGSAQAAAGRNEQAVRAYYYCLQKNPSAALARAVLNNLSRLAIARNDYKESLIWMEKASRIQ